MALQNPFLRGQYAAQEANQSAEQANLSGLATLFKLQQAAQEQPDRMALLKAQVADLQAKPQDRANAMENNRQMALSRLQQAASQFDQTMQLKIRQATTAEARDAATREYQQGRLALEAAARQQGADRLFYDTGIRSPAVPAVGAPPAAPASGLEPRQSGGLEGRFPPVGPQAAPAGIAPLPAQPPAAPAVAPLPKMPEFTGSPKEIAAAKNKWLLDQSKAATAGTGDFSKTGAEFLATLPPQDQQMVKKVAAYEMDPRTFSTRGGNRERILAMAAQYDPTFDQKNYNAISQAVNRFATGQHGNIVRSLNVAIEHLDTLKRASDALKNGNFTPGNLAYNEVSKLFGQSAPTTFEGIRDIVANEVVKGTIGTAGALEDRAKAAAAVRAQNSPQQLADLFNGWTELMGGQVKGLEQQYKGATSRNDFEERFLSPRTRDAINLARSNAGASPQRRSNVMRFDAQGNMVQ